MITFRIFLALHKRLFPSRYKTLSTQVLFTAPVTDVRFNELSYVSQLDHHYSLRTVGSLQFLSAHVRLNEAKDTSGMELITRVQPKPSSIMQGHQSVRTNYSSTGHLRRKLSYTVAYERFDTQSLIENVCKHYKPTRQLYQFSQYSAGYKVYSQV